MIKINLSLVVLFFSFTILFSHPARPGVIHATQKDGSTLAIKTFGDEHYHYLTTEDDYLIAKDSNGIYVYVDEEGNPSQFKAKNKEKRSSDEKSFLNKLNQGKVKEKHRSLKPNSFPKQNKQLNINNQSQIQDSSSEAPVICKRPQPASWTIGERRIPVILLSTLDKAAGDSTLYYRFFNEPGFSEEQNIGSLRDYYLASSDSLLDIHFDIFPVKVNRNLADYVDNETLQEGLLLKEAIDELVKNPSFSGSNYCFNGIVIDGFLFLFPGTEIDALELSDTFWAHQYSMTWNGSSARPVSYVAGGYSFNTYAFVAQKEDYKESNINELGIFAHEFSHVLGLKDHYGYYEETFIEGPAPWDIMTQGMYNGNGRKPPTFSAFERASMGWISLTELSTSQDVFTLASLDNRQAYSITNTDNYDEHFIIEYRPSVGFDSGIENTGVLVWYVDYDQDSWTNNNPNGDPNHARIAVRDVILGTKTSKKSYSPFIFVDDSNSEISGVYAFKKGDNNDVCFSINSSATDLSCSELTSIGTQIQSNYELSVMGQDLHIYLPFIGEKILKVTDMKGKILHSSLMLSNYKTLSLQNKGVYLVQVSLDKKPLVSKVVIIR